MHAATLRGTGLQKQATELFAANMRRKLAKKPWIADSRTCFPQRWYSSFALIVEPCACRGQ